MKPIRLAWGILALACCAGMVRAEVPPIIRFQGVLTDTSSVPLSDESVVLIFGLYDAAEQGTRVWTQTFNPVPIRDGFYEVALGDPTAPQAPPLTDVPFDRPYFLEIAFQRANQTTPVILGPRKPLGSVPYSFRSGSSDQTSGGQGDSVAVLPGGGLELRRSAVRPLVEIGIGQGGIDRVMVKDSVLTADKIAPGEVVTSVSFSEPGTRVEFKDGVTMEAGANIDFLFPPNVPENSVRIVAQVTGGGGGDVTDVHGGAGLRGSTEGGPEVFLSVGQGDGLLVEEDLVSVDVPSIAGEGLTTAGDPPKLAVQPGDGIELVAGKVQAGLGTGLQFAGTRIAADTLWSDGRYVQHGETGSVTAGMIVPDIVSTLNLVKGNGEGNIQLVGRGIVSITGDPINSQILIDATGGNGDITAVAADNGLTGGGVTGDVSLAVAVGSGLEIFADAVRLADNGVTAAKIGNDAVGSAEIAADAVTSAEIADNAVGSTEIGNDAVGSAEIAADAVTSAEIADNAVGSTEIASDAVGSAEIAANAITSAEIADNAVSSTEIASDAVGSAEIAADAITSAKIADNAVGSTEIASDAVGSAEIAANAITSAKIADNSIGTADVSVNILSSLNGIASDGGNIDLVPGPNATLSVDDVNKRIVLSPTADGNSLDTLDGSLQDVVRVDNVGRVGVNVPVPQPPEATLHVRQGPNVQGIRIQRNDTPDHWETSIDPQLNYLFLFNDSPKSFIEFGTGAYFTLMLPRDAQPLGPTLEKVLRLKPSVSGQPGVPAPSSAAVGFMAQDVAALFPEIVREREGLQGLDYSAVSVLAIRAIQEQQELIEEQRAEIAELRRALDLQEQRLASLESRR